jgi:hypothetical protein
LENSGRLIVTFTGVNPLPPGSLRAAVQEFEATVHRSGAPEFLKKEGTDAGVLRIKTWMIKADNPGALFTVSGNSRLRQLHFSPEDVRNVKSPKDLMLVKRIPSRRGGRRT